MIKTIGGAIKHPANRSLEEFHRYWGEHHGPLFANTPHLRRYVQHHTLHEAYGGLPAPTHDGVSMFWYDDLESLQHPPKSPTLREAVREDNKDVHDWYVRTARYGPPDSMTLSETVRADDRQLFDRTPEWPLNHKRVSVIATERVVVEGATTPSMVKAVFFVARIPGLSLEEFQQHWYEVHGPLVAKLPGLRRYVQNHAIQEANAVRPMTHDGFAELWFDDLAALRLAYASPEWQALREDGRALLGQPVGLVIARERIQKG